MRAGPTRERRLGARPDGFEGFEWTLPDRSTLRAASAAASGAISGGGSSGGSVGGIFSRGGGPSGGPPVGRRGSAGSGGIGGGSSSPRCSICSLLCCTCMLVASAVILLTLLLAYAHPRLPSNLRMHQHPRAGHRLARQAQLLRGAAVGAGGIASRLRSAVVGVDLSPDESVWASGGGIVGELGSARKERSQRRNQIQGGKMGKIAGMGKQQRRAGFDDGYDGLGKRTFDRTGGKRGGWQQRGEGVRADAERVAEEAEEAEELDEVEKGMHLGEHRGSGGNRGSASARASGGEWKRGSGSGRASGGKTARSGADDDDDDEKEEEEEEEEEEKEEEEENKVRRGGGGEEVTNEAEAAEGDAGEAHAGGERGRAKGDINEDDAVSVVGRDSNEVSSARGGAGVRKGRGYSSEVGRRRGKGKGRRGRRGVGRGEYDVDIRRKVSRRYVDDEGEGEEDGEEAEEEEAEEGEVHGGKRGKARAVVHGEGEDEEGGGRGRGGCEGKENAEGGEERER
ncbi:unnamed protein product [Closterium sp. Yama58-4]|nr:unnamed protein product [Closterium sp. Yama58-4]